MKKIVLMITLLLTLILLTSCDNMSKPNIGNEVDEVYYNGYSINYTWNVFDLMNAITLNHSDYCYDYNATFQLGDEEEYSVKGSQYRYTKPIESYNGLVSNDIIYYKYATTSKNLVTFYLYDGGSIYSLAPAAQRYVANLIPVVASCIYEDRTLKTLPNGYESYPINTDVNTAPYLDYCLACTRFPQIYDMHNILYVPTNNKENYNYSFKLYEKYIVFNFENPYGIGFGDGAHRPQDELAAMREDAYFKAEIYFNAETSTIDYYYFDTVSYSLYSNAKRVKCTATVVRVDITAAEIQKKINDVFIANENTIGFGKY